MAVELIPPFHTAVLIATFRCAAPAPCCAFADERSVVGDCGGPCEDDQSEYGQ
jgi:hypothetical protein